MYLQKKALEQTLKKSPDNSVANVQYALTLWSLQNHSNWRDRIKIPLLIDHHLCIALTSTIKSSDELYNSQILYYYGRLKFEFAHFSYFECFIYKLLTIPFSNKNNLQQAFDLFFKVYTMNPTFEENLFYLILCSIKLHRIIEAIDYLKLLLSLEIQDEKLHHDANYLYHEILFDFNVKIVKSQ